MKRNVVIAAGIIILVVVMTGAYKKIGLPTTGSIKGITASSANIGIDAAKEKATNFVKNNLVQPGTEATVKEITEENGMYKIVFTVGKQEITTYMTKDGTKFFPQVMDMAEVEKQSADQKKKQEDASKDAPKSDKPEVSLYVMAFCPFGNKAEDTMKPVFDLLKNKVDFNFHYIVSTSGDKVSSLHGEKEVTQDEREACVLRDYGKDKWMSFVTYVNSNCGSDGSCWETGAKNAGLDTTKITSCVTNDGLALMQAEEKAANSASASGSPTMEINGQVTNVVYQYGNSDAYKQAICKAFNDEPSECSQTLSSSTSTTQGGSCGN